MKNLKNALFYFTVTGVFTALIYWVVGQGKNLEIGRKITTTSVKNSEWNQFLDSLTHNLHHPLAILLGQIITIIIVARFFGWIFKKDL